MKNGKNDKKKLMRELDLSRAHIIEPESTAIVSVPGDPLPQEASVTMMNDSGVGLENILQKRIDELLEENGSLKDEISRLKEGIEWLDQNRGRFGGLARRLPRPPHQDDMKADLKGADSIESRLQQAQKMETVGVLAGGIAHDFNNILTAIIASASLMQRGLDAGSPLRRHLDRIFASAERATALTQSILAYSRRQPSEPSPIKLNLIVENLRKLLSRLVPENITFSLSLSGRDLLIMADIGQIEHVIMNLVGNAIDAMPGGGKLVIKTGLSGSDESDTIPSYIESGEYAVLTVEDTGTGMDESTRERLFEPFFTTKEVGKGTGLGLAMAYGIVKQHNGYIDVRSVEGHGTSFHLYFPLQDVSVKGDGSGFAPPVLSGGETILLIEDDGDVRNLLREMLESYGYRVIEAFDGVDGVEKFMEHQDHIGLLISDIMMPGKNGKEAYKEICKIRGDVRAIFISGYSDSATNEILGKGMTFLAKPVSPLELLKRIREVIDDERSQDNLCR